MRSTCAEPSFPTSASGLWLSLLLSEFALLLESVLLSVEVAKVASGAMARVGVT